MYVFCIYFISCLLLLGDSRRFYIYIYIYEDAFENCVWEIIDFDLIDIHSSVCSSSELYLYVLFFLLLKISPFAGLLFISVIIHRILVARSQSTSTFRYRIESNTKFHET